MRRTVITVALVLALIGLGPAPAGALTAEEAALTERVSVSGTGAQSDGFSSKPRLSADGRYAVFASDAGNLAPGDTNWIRDIYLRDRIAGTTQRVSVGTGNVDADGESYDPDVSADGRYVAFHSFATNLAGGTDTNNTWDVFVRDVVRGTTTLLTPGANGGSSGASISGDGRYVVFASGASNLVPGDTNGTDDVFLHDRESGTTTMISTRPDGSPVNGWSELPRLSEDGRFVVFDSIASDLVAGDGNGVSDVFLRDVAAATTVRVSAAVTGEGNDWSYDADVSAWGDFVTFASDATNLATGDTNGSTDVYLYRRSTGSVERVSIGSGGAEPNAWSDYPVVSADGRYVAFESGATNLVPAAVTTSQVYVRDTLQATTALVSGHTDGVPGDSSASRASMSADGLFVAFGSWATDLVAGDTNSASDAFVRRLAAKRTTSRVSVDTGGAQGNGSSSSSVATSADGSVVVFSSSASNLVPGDTNGKEDVFVRDRAAGATARVSIGVGGAESNGRSGRSMVSISANGRFVTFDSSASNLVPDDTNGARDVFLHDRETGATARVSATPSGFAAVAWSDASAISDDGRYVALLSHAGPSVPADPGSTIRGVYLRDMTTGVLTLIADQPNWSWDNGVAITPDGRWVTYAAWDTDIVGGDTNSTSDVFVYDRFTGGNERVSVNSAGAQANSASGPSGVAISGDGRYVAFSSDATNLVADDTNGDRDVFVRDRSLGITTRASVSSAGKAGNGTSDIPDLSANGRYVVFGSWASNLVAGDTNGAQDTFVRDLRGGRTIRVSTSSYGVQANGPSAGQAISADGSWVAFTSSATTLVDGDTNAMSDVFVHEVAPSDFVRRDVLELLGWEPNYGYAADPVSTATGNFVHSEADLDFPDFGMQWVRTYNSLDRSSSVLGHGWRHNFSMRLDEGADGTLHLLDADGRRAVFTPSGGGWARATGIRASATRELDGTLRLDYDDGHVARFDGFGRLEQLANWDGQTVGATYTGGLLTTLVGSTGNAFELTYTSGRLARVATSDGRHVDYGYDGADLVNATSASGGVTVYGLDSADRVESITDPDGVATIVNEYDDRGRVAMQTLPSADTVTFTYDDGAGVTAVHRQGSGATTSYTHDHDGRLLSVEDHFGKIVWRSYDAAGNLLSVVDRRGAGTAQTFDAHGNLLTRTSAEGVVESFTYDASDRLVSATDGEQQTTLFDYSGTERLPSTVTDANGEDSTYDVSATGLIMSATDADGVTLTFGYDAGRRLHTVTDVAGKVTTLGYDGAGNLTSVATPTGRLTTSTFDAMRRLLTRTDPTDATVVQTWTPAGRLATYKDAELRLTSFDYDGAGRLETVTDALNHQVSYGYDADGNLTSVTRPGNADAPSVKSVWTATYDELGRRTSETDPTKPVGVTTSYDYDDDGNLTVSTDAAGHEVKRTYDLRGRLTKVVDELTHETKYEYDRVDRVVKVIDPLLHETSYDYDGVGRPLSTTRPGGRVWATEYTPAGRLFTETDPNLAATVHSYDNRGRLETTTLPEGGIVQFGYDDDGRLTSVTSPEGLVTAYGYDDDLRQGTVTAPSGGVTTRTFTARGQLSAVDGPETAPVQFFYDELGRLDTARDAFGRDTVFEYDDRGNLVQRTNARGKVDSYSYDLADRLLSHRDPLGRVTNLGYDELGRLASVADPSGRSLTVGYDIASRVTSRTFGSVGAVPGLSVTYGYDDANRVISMTDSTGTTSFGWNAVGQLESMVRPGGSAMSFDHDPGGNRTELTFPDGTTAAFTYDGDNRLATMTHPQAGTVAYGYDDDGRLLTEDLPGTDGRTWSYDVFGRLESYAESLGGQTRTTALSHDPADRVSSETTGGVTTAYGYDISGALDSVTRGPTVTAYEYDEVGNRKATTKGAVRNEFAYDDASQLTGVVKKVAGIQVASAAFTHDGAGRLTGATSGSVARTFGYDAKGSLATVVASAGGGLVSSTTTRTTDGDGRLVGLAFAGPTGSSSTDVFWDLAPASASAVPQVATTRTGGVDTNHLLGVGDRRELAIRGGQADVFALDVHGSAEARGEAADLARAGGYDAFGIPVATSPQSLLDELLGSPAQDVRFGYRGEPTADGLLNLRAREYAPGVGRFTSVDPLPGVPGSVTVANPYPYAANDPVNLVDPLGLSPVSDEDLRVSYQPIAAVAALAPAVPLAGGAAAGLAGLVTAPVAGGAIAGPLGIAVGAGALLGTGIWYTDALGLNDTLEGVGAAIYDLLDPEPDPKKFEVPPPTTTRRIDRSKDALFDTTVLVYAINGQSPEGLALLLSHHVLLTERVIAEFLNVRSPDQLVQRLAFLAMLDIEVYSNPYAKQTTTYKRIEKLAMDHRKGATDAELLGYSRVANITLYTAEERLHHFATQTLVPELQPPIEHVSWY